MILGKKNGINDQYHPVHPMQFQRQATDGPVCYVSAGRAHPVSMSQDQALDDAEWCLNRSPAQRSCSVSSPSRLLGAVSRRWVCHSKLGTCGGPSRAAQASRLSRSRECRMPSREMVGDESIATKSGDLSHPRPVAEERPSSRSPPRARRLFATLLFRSNLKSRRDLSACPP
jgi:hypothetical protein